MGCMLYEGWFIVVVVVAVVSSDEYLLFFFFLNTFSLYVGGGKASCYYTLLHSIIFYLGIAFGNRLTPYVSMI